MQCQSAAMVTWQERCSQERCSKEQGPHLVPELPARLLTSLLDGYARPGPRLCMDWSPLPIWSVAPSEFAMNIRFDTSRECADEGCARWVTVE